MSEGVNERRKIISVFSTVERLNQHQTAYLNYLKLLVASKGMLLTVDKESLPEDSAYSNNKNRETDFQNGINIECSKFKRYRK